jgi:phenylpropionate dioxygenase-like ring-hydroxylating dioxygenase large terminal subunit
MIPDQWYIVLDSREVKPGKPVGVTRMGEKMVFWRDAQGHLAAALDLCPHRGAAFSIGKVIGDCVECPFHGFQFDPTGRCTVIPANGRSAPVPKAMKVRAFAVREAHGFVYLWWGEMVDTYPELPWFNDFGDEADYSYRTGKDHWPVHYTRAIENQMDMEHVPFVHANSIGRGVGTVVDNPRVEWTGPDRFSMYVRYRPDDGQTRANDDPLPADPKSFHLEFIFPNVWQNYLGSKSRIVSIFVPVDESNCLLYFRFYQKFVRVPGLRTAVDWLSMPMNRFILGQDKRVVVTERPVKTDLRMGEKLIPADGPIVAYRRQREALQSAAGVNGLKVR